MSIARHHAEWLSLLEISGPFLSMPVLMDAFPQRLPADDPATAQELRAVYEEWLHEEIITGGGTIQHGRFRRMNVGETERAVSAGTGQPISASMEQRLADLWPDIRPSLERSLEVRAQERTAGLERLLRERAEKEIRDIEAILRELARAIERELDTPAYRQLELFSDNERSQLTRNTEALRQRLEQIPTEIEAEQAAIRVRYASPQPRLFPVQ